MNQMDTTRELRKYLAIILRWSWLIALCMVVAGSGAFIVSKLQSPVYRATTLLMVDQQPVGQDTTYNNVLASQQLVASYVTLVPQPAVLQRAVSGIHGISARELATELQVTAPSGTQIIQIQVLDASPIRSARLANAIAAAFITSQTQAVQGSLRNVQRQINQSLDQLATQIDSLTKQIAALQAQNPNSPSLQMLQGQFNDALAERTNLQTIISQLTVESLVNSGNIHVFQPAVPPITPDRPKPALYSVIGAALGLIVAGAIVFIVEYMDDRIRKAEDVERRIGLPTIGTVEAVQKRSNLSVVGAAGVRPTPNTLLTANRPGPLSECFRILRTNLNFASPDRLLRTILVTSPTPGDGKTTTAINLAISMGRSGKRVLLVDADLRYPAIHAFLGLPNVSGLSSHLADEQQDHEANLRFIATVPDQPNLYVLPAGPKPPNPTELLGSERMQHLLRSVLRNEHGNGLVDVVVLDCPPILSLADAPILAGRADGTLVVVDAAHAHEREVLDAKAALLQANARIIGVVLNRIIRKRGEVYYRRKREVQEYSVPVPDRAHA